MSAPIIKKNRMANLCFLSSRRRHDISKIRVADMRRKDFTGCYEVKKPVYGVDTPNADWTACLPFELALALVENIPAKVSGSPARKARGNLLLAASG